MAFMVDEGACKACHDIVALIHYLCDGIVKISRRLLVASATLSSRAIISGACLVTKQRQAQSTALKLKTVSVTTLS